MKGFRGPLPGSFDDPQDSHDPIAIQSDKQPSDDAPLVTLPQRDVSRETNKPAPEKKPEGPKPRVGSDERGVLQGETMDEQWRVACAIASSGMVPAQFANKPGAVLVAMQSAKERGLNPWNALQMSANINGRASNFGELPLGEVYQSNLLEEFEEWWIDENGEQVDPIEHIATFHEVVFAAVCQVQRKGRKPVIRAYSLAMADRAKLRGKDTWKQYPERMLQMRARGWALKDAFADVIGGLPMPEYDEFEPEPKTEREGSLVSKLKDAVDGLGKENKPEAPSAG